MTNPIGHRGSWKSQRRKAPFRFLAGAALTCALACAAAATIACAPKPKPAQPGPKATLKWRTESEQDNFGFYLEKGDSPQGPFATITSKIIAGHGTTNTPHDYEYIDTNVEAGKTYYYRLWTISYQNVKRQIGETIHYTVKAANEKEDGKKP